MEEKVKGVSLFKGIMIQNLAPNYIIELLKTHFCLNM